jgi:Flp pilus assembly protein TadD
VVVCVALAFRGALEAGFIFFDDGTMVTKNPFVRLGFGLDGARWALTGVWGANWMPLTWISHQLDWSLFLDEPRGHHLVSLTLHALACGLLVSALHTLGASLVSSVLVTLLFAVHPLRAESVVWVAERKDVLSALFAIVVWWRFARARAANRVVDAGLLLALVAGLCSKSMVVTLPAVLVLLEAWRTQRVPSWSFIKQLWPTVVPVVVTSVIVSQAQAGTAAVAQLSFLQRLGGAIVAVAEYLRLTVWPTSLSVFHPARVAGPDVADVAAALALLVAVTAALTTLWRRGIRAPLVGWLWFLGMLVPVSGVFPLGAHAFAERYTHLPHIGLFFGIVVGVEELLRHRSRATRMAAATVAAVLVFAEVVVLQEVVATWRSNSTLTAAGLRTDPDNPMLLPVRADALLATGAVGNAIERYEHALAARHVYMATSGIDHAWAQLGLALLSVPSELPQAHRVLREAVRLGPRNGLARRGLSVALFRSGAHSDGLREARVAVELMPDDATQRLNLASLLLSAGDAAGALSSLQTAPAHLRRELAAVTMRAAFLKGGCRLAATTAEALASSAPPTAFVAEQALALACLNDPRAPALLATLSSTTPTRAGALAMLMAGLRDGADVSPLLGVIAATPAEPGLESDRLALVLQTPLQLSAVLALLEPSPVTP